MNNTKIKGIAVVVTMWDMNKGTENPYNNLFELTKVTGVYPSDILCTEISDKSIEYIP